MPARPPGRQSLWSYPGAGAIRSFFDMGLFALLLVIAIACFFVGLFVTTLKWLLIVAAVLFLASLISGFFRGRATTV